MTNFLNKYWWVLLIIPLFLLVLLPILAGILLVAVNPAGQISKARDAKRIADNQILKQALFSYYQDNKKYPMSLDDLSPDYVKQIPVDPKTSQKYEYKTNKNQDFQVCVILEKDNAKHCETNLVVD